MKTVITTMGSLDECRPLRKLARRERMAVVTGEQAFVRGWLAPPPKQKAIRALRLKFGAIACEIPYGFVRNDVAEHLNLHDSRVGFEGSANIPMELVYATELSVSAVLTDGTPVVAEQATSLPCYVVNSIRPGPPTDATESGALSRIRLIADAVPAAPLHGRSRRSVRDDAAVEVRGWILDRRRSGPGEDIALLLRRDGRLIGSFPAKREFDGEASSLVGHYLEAGFCARINVTDLGAGLYSLAPAVLDGDVWLSGAEEHFERCVPYDPAPRFLPIFRQRAPGIAAFLDGERIQRGTPLAVRGWAKDPVTGDGGRGVYARIDDHHFLPLPSNLDEPNAEPAARGVGFSGIIDTTILLPGTHRVDIALFSKAGSGWYTLGSRAIEITA